LFRKMLPWVIIVLVSITLIIGAAFFMFQYMKDDQSAADPNKEAKDSVEQVEPKKLSADEVVELTVNMDDIITNLNDRDYVVKVSFAFQLENVKSKEEFEKIKEITVRPIIIRSLADIGPDELSGAKGMDDLTSKLMNLINPVLNEGKLTKIDITNFIISEV
jgi:flagellar FliL protein